MPNNVKGIGKASQLLVFPYGPCYALEGAGTFVQGINLRHQFGSYLGKDSVGNFVILSSQPLLELLSQVVVRVCRLYQQPTGPLTTSYCVGLVIFPLL